MLELVLLEPHQPPASLDQHQRQGRQDEHGGRGHGQRDAQQQVRIPGFRVEYFFKVILKKRRKKQVYHFCSLKVVFILVVLYTTRWQISLR